MHLKFYKYQGTGNDFVLIDNRKADVQLNQEQVAFLCHRNFGIGADGLMLLEKSNQYDFEMKYYNADGNLGSMCGNGGRCMVKFARDLDVVDEQVMFLAFDGVHEANITEDGLVELEMSNVTAIKKIDDTTCELNTGSPHFVQFVNDVHSLDVFQQGKKIRYSEEYAEKGINVNFVSVLNNELQIRTYERGVEDETLSCGTGVTAAAIAAVHLGLVQMQDSFVRVKTLGGDLLVRFEQSNHHFVNVVLVGPALKCFEGEIVI
ncbi:MAG: diaminopimelate epimerase [Bacteroidota bacterium]